MPVAAEAVAPAPVGIITRPPVLATAPVISPVTFGRLGAGTFGTLRPVPLPPAPAGGGVQDPAPGGGQPPTGNVSILAFICTQLPRCPNPDPALTW